MSGILNPISPIARPTIPPNVIEHLKALSDYWNSLENEDHELWFYPSSEHDMFRPNPWMTEDGHSEQTAPRPAQYDHTLLAEGATQGPKGLELYFAANLTPKQYCIQIPQDTAYWNGAQTASFKITLPDSGPIWHAASLYFVAINTSGLTFTTRAEDSQGNRIGVDQKRDIYQGLGLEVDHFLGWTALVQPIASVTISTNTIAGSKSVLLLQMIVYSGRC